MPDAPEPSAGAGTAGAAQPGRRPWLLVLLLAAIVVLGVGYALERGRANTLAGQVVGLEADLQTAQDGLRAAHRRMELVRTHVDDLAVRLGLLQQVVAEAGEAGEPPAATASGDAAGETGEPAP